VRYALSLRTKLERRSTNGFALMRCAPCRSYK
jgi:hypothetical protein